MKITSYLTLGLLAFSLSPVWGQNNAGTLQLSGQPITVSQTGTAKLTKFNLKFPGGTPAQLVTAIENATGKPLNVIIPNEAANTQLPPLKMDNVTTPQLFSALEAASNKREIRSYPNHIPFGGGDSYQIITTSYGFKTDSDPADDSIWYFHVDNPPAPPQSPEHPPVNICRFYQLAPYLNSGLTVDDITTAIQTGWKMMGEEQAPLINFHKETKLLIAVGQETQLQVISDVLNQLQQMPAAGHPVDSRHFQERLQSIIKRAPQTQTDISAPAALSPEAKTILLETEREKNPPATPPPAPKPALPADVKP